jgi:mRNA interferase HigB
MWGRATKYYLASIKFPFVKLFITFDSNMRIHLIRQESINKYVKVNAQSKLPLTKWLALIKNADWNNPNDIRKTFGSVDFLGNNSNRLIFNIGGNKYRLICSYYFGKKKLHLFVKWIGTHAEYSELCKFEKQYTVGIY